MNTIFSRIGARSLVIRFVLQIMLGVSFGAANMMAHAAADMPVPLIQQSRTLQAGAFPGTNSQPSDDTPATSNASDTSATPAFVGPGWG